MVKTGFFNRQMFWGKIASLIFIALTALIISGAPAWAFDSSLPDNTVYVINEFESGFHGPGDPSDAWGSNDQLLFLKGSIIFMADGTFAATSTTDDELNRTIGDDPQGNNTFTTTRTQQPGSASGTYSVTPDGVITITFTFEGEDPDVMTGVLSADGQTVIFGYSEYSESEKHASCGIGVAVKKGSGFASSFPDNTVYVINEFESGFHGPGDPSDAWGSNDQLLFLKGSIIFMADGTFAATSTTDDELNRTIGDDPQGNNTFTTTRTQQPGSASGTYSVTPDGVITITFTFEGEDPDVMTGVLSANGQTVIFGYSEYNESEKHASCGIGVGVKKGSGFDSSFPDNTVYVINEFESGFHGVDSSGGAGWGANDQLFIVKAIFTFMANGDFTGTYSNDDRLTRFIGDDGEGGNTFTTTFEGDSGSLSGTYTISSDGVVTITIIFAGEDPDIITGVLSADGQTVIFGYSEYDDSQSEASFGIGVGVKRAVTQKPILTPIFLLLNE